MVRRLRRCAGGGTAAGSFERRRVIFLRAKYLMIVQKPGVFHELGAECGARADGIAGHPEADAMNDFKGYAELFDTLLRARL